VSRREVIRETANYPTVEMKEDIASLWVVKEAKQRDMILVVRPIIEELLAIGY